ncbi:MAG: Na+/H+ antiporter NhaA [Chloroflexi bacterium]|nr:Na+/H+ antiporter NhaA [Chloroflexota bacterium]
MDELRDRAALRTGQRRNRPERRCVRPPVWLAAGHRRHRRLVVAKTLGILAGAWLATRSFLGGLPLSVGWPSLIAASSVAGIGFTVSLLIADLSYTGVLLGARSWASSPRRSWPRS